MKRGVALLLIGVMAVSLTACASVPPYETTVTVKTMGDLSFKVDPLSRTITHGEEEYHYNKDGSWVVITYPNGGIYREDLETGKNGQIGTGKNVPGNVLVSVLTEEALSVEKEPWIVVVSAIFALMGLWHVLLPRKSLFMLAYGWGIWKAEESSANVRAVRLIGAIMVAAALFCIVLA